MPGKVFISCGQNSEEERKIANEIKAWFEDPPRGYSAYVVINVQRLEDINDAIVKELVSADYFIFIDFRREKIKWCKYRGSLFSHQELALAYYLGFENTILLIENGVLVEGFLQYIQSNPRVFKRRDQILNLIEEDVRVRNWSPMYSRHLTVEGIEKLPMTISYGDYTGSYNSATVFECRIRNNRNYTTAMYSSAVLRKINGLSSPDTSYLKWAGLWEVVGYYQIIFPQSEGRLCLLQIDNNNPLHVFLQSARDVVPRVPIISGPVGRYRLSYEVFAVGFPMLEFEVDLDLTGNPATTNTILVGSGGLSLDGH